MLGRFPQRFHELQRVYVGEAREPAKVLSCRPLGLGLLLKLDTVRSRDAARSLFGRFLYVPETEAIALPSGEYFVHQIVGLSVVTDHGVTLGNIVEVLETGSNDVYVVRGPTGEALLPATKEVIKEIDLEARRMVVSLIPGLVD